MKKIRQTYCLDEDLIQFIKQVAKKENRSDGNVVRNILRKEKDNYVKKTN